MQPELSIVMPCLNESRTLAACIEKAQLFLKQHDISGEVIIADNGSTDGSMEIAWSMNATVVKVEQRGYGEALAAGIEAAKGKYVIMGDSDESFRAFFVTGGQTLLGGFYFGLLNLIGERKTQQRTPNGFQVEVKGDS
jgi:glycosyltransferase involved in cell wall biosynthesis